LAFKLSPEHIRRSAYARQLASGSTSLRFEPRLEEEFRISYSKDNFTRQRLMVMFGTVLILVFAAADYFRLSGDARDWSLIIRLGVIIPLLLIALVLSFLQSTRRFLEQVIMLLLVVVGASIVSIFYIAAANGQAYQPEGLYMIAVVTYFLTGLLFSRAVICSALVLGLFVAGRLFVDQAVPMLGFYAFAFFMLNLLCAIGCYLLEQRTRLSFLTYAILVEAADHDGLTGIANRRAMDVRLDELVARSLTSHQPLALLLLDLDHFKDYNDRYGHLEGDRCLRQVTQVMQDFARRPQDMAARYGGEEFALLLFDLSPQAALHQAEAVRIAISDLAIPHVLNKPARVMTTSIGVAVLEPGKGGSSVALLATADQALYAAKHAGRNRVEMLAMSHGLEEE
jgi:diguanylate cyclase (GGDEF)-like protein